MRMRFRTWLAIIVAVLTAAFFIVNWRVFAAPVRLDLLVFAVESPVGVVMLVLFVLVMLVLSAYVGVWQGTLLMEFRRQTKELQAQRTLAESAEASRFTALGKLVHDEIEISDKRLELALEALRGEFRDTERSLAAALAEMDDRIRRGVTPP